MEERVERRERELKEREEEQFFSKIAEEMEGGKCASMQVLLYV